MIAATPSPSWDDLTARLATLAGQIAQDREAVDAPDDPADRRDPAALWPGFGTAKG